MLHVLPFQPVRTSKDVPALAEIEIMFLQDQLNRFGRIGSFFSMTFCVLFIVFDVGFSTSAFAAKCPEIAVTPQSSAATESEDDLPVHQDRNRVGAIRDSFGNTAEDAIAAAKAYIAQHNAHNLEIAMECYAPEASFQLSNGRAFILGRENIRELERFDAIAQSTLLPFGWSARKIDDLWAVSVQGVIENSIIFSAIGLKIVVAKPEKPVFLIHNGLITHSEQPSLLPPCQTAAFAAIAGVGKWMVENNDVRAKGLLDEGRLKLEPHLLPLVAQLISEWRIKTGWSPSVGQITGCGSVDATLVNQLGNDEVLSSAAFEPPHRPSTHQALRAQQ